MSALPAMTGDHPEKIKCLLEPETIINRFVLDSLIERKGIDGLAVLDEEAKPSRLGLHAFNKNSLLRISRGATRAPSKKFGAERCLSIVIRWRNGLRSAPAINCTTSSLPGSGMPGRWRQNCWFKRTSSWVAAMLTSGALTHSFAPSAIWKTCLSHALDAALEIIGIFKRQDAPLSLN